MSDPLTPYFTFEGIGGGRLHSRLFKEIMHLRYEVYCLECNFLDAHAYTEEVESDGYDSRSYHVAAHNLDGLLVGSVRLVCGGVGERFPFEDHCMVFDDFKFPPRAQCAEVSRLIVRRDFRRRPGDSLEGVSAEFQDHGHVEAGGCDMSRSAVRRRSGNPQILLGLYRAMYRHSRRAGIRYWFAAMEKSLARATHRIGFHFVPVGPEADYFGPVTPHVLDLWGVHDSLKLSADDSDGSASWLSRRWNLFGGRLHA